MEETHASVARGKIDRISAKNGPHLKEKIHLFQVYPKVIEITFAGT